ncbi:hypothetical protein CCHR01_11177 [Colletotrichum chrysophilum]|uniref:Uncharacterized protein n=1 Tax=Colletotrichum chrysophilum TaxID=1836956 RepID=A0AAD9AFU6_9PEZI|nr:hypothetical protein CCHR01_11177 [Colletotrichum chrysophilum]
MAVVLGGSGEIIGAGTDAAAERIPHREPAGEPTAWGQKGPAILRSDGIATEEAKSGAKTALRLAIPGRGGVKSSTQLQARRGFGKPEVRPRDL